MAGMTTVLTEFSTVENSRTSTLSGHTAALPKIVIEKRRVPTGNQVMAEFSTKVVYATQDANSETLQEKVSHEVITRYPINGTYTDVTGALAIIRDILAGDEYANSVETQEFL
jgi:hypothetical protein